MSFHQHQLWSIKNLFRKRWPWGYRSFPIILFGLCVLAYELWEYYSDSQGITAGIILEVFFFGLVFPILSLLFGRLDSKVKQQNSTINNLHHLHDFESRIANIEDWEQLVTTLVFFPSTIAPITNAVLLIYDEKQAKFIVSSHYGARLGSSSNQGSYLPQNFDPICNTVRSHDGRQMLCNCLLQGHLTLTAVKKNRYCLPLNHGSKLVGMLHLYLPTDEVITPEQAQLIAGFVPSIVMAINAIRWLNDDTKPIRTLETEWRQIARFIHDSLGHNLAFLRLRLDQLASDEKIADVYQLREDLKNLSETANLAYWQMRMVLADLNLKTPPDLVETLQNNLEIIKEHSHLDTLFTIDGEPKMLSNFVRRRVLLIVNELMANIEQHSNALRIDLNLTWGQEDVSISISDDGQGFSPVAESNKPGHFGLRIIQECKNEINGHLAYESFPEVGNRTTLCFPLLTSSPNEPNFVPTTLMESRYRQRSKTE